MFRKILTASLVAVSLAGATLVTSAPAEARYGRHGAFFGGAALGLLGGALLSGGFGYGYGYGRPYYYNDYQPVYYYPRRCHLEQRFVDDYYYGGHYVTVRVCY
jgi:hypothetical protein